MASVVPVNLMTLRTSGQRPSELSVRDWVCAVHAMLVPFPTAGSKLTDTGNIRLAVCGTGFWAEQVHLPGLSQTGHFRLVGLWGRSSERSHALASQFGIRAFSSFEEMLGAVDAVSFAIPPDLQAKMALRAIHAGRHVLLEKPLATSLHVADAIVAAAQDRRIAAMLYLPRLRSKPIADLMQTARTLQASQGAATFLSGALLAGSPFAGSAWRNDRFGPLWDIGPHVLSVLMSVLGPIRQVEAAMPRDASFELICEHLGGATSTGRIDLMDTKVEGFVEHYSFAGSDGSVESDQLAHDRLGFFSNALEAFAAAIANPSGPNNLVLGRDITATLESACDSVLHARPYRVQCLSKGY